MSQPLNGITILDLTRVLSGPYATMLLRDLGATVIKLENPKGGDDSRTFGPLLNGESLYFASFNRGKKSISLNLKTEEGKALVRDLVKSGKIDVIAENFRPTTMERLGLGYEDLKALNPKIIYASISGFGHTGPDSALPSYDILAQARGGIMSLTGHEGAPPTKIGSAYGDLTAGLFAAFGIVSALLKRERTGEGDKVDISMLDCMASFLENALVLYQTSHEAPKPRGSAHPSLAPFQAFKAQDKYFVIGVANDALWQKLRDAIDFGDDTDFATVELRDKHKARLAELLTNIFAGKPAAEWLKIISAAGVPCSAIADISEVMQDTQLIARNMFIPIAGTDIKLAGNPVKLSSTTAPKATEESAYPPPPKIGQDNTEILSKFLGLSQENISNLKDKGVL